MRASDLNTDGVIPVGNDLGVPPKNTNKKAMHNMIMKNAASNNEFDAAADRQR